MDTDIDTIRRRNCLSSINIISQISLRRCKSRLVKSHCLVWLLLIITITQSSPTLAEQDDDKRTNGTNNTGISGKFFEYMNNLGSSANLNSYKPSNATTTFTFLDTNSWNDAYQKFLKQVARVRGMFHRNLSRGANSTSIIGDGDLSSSDNISTSTESGIFANSNTSHTNSTSNRSGRINNPLYAWENWDWPWGSSPTTSSTPRSRSPFNRIFFGPFDSSRSGSEINNDGIPDNYNPYYPPRSPNAFGGSNGGIFGRGVAPSPTDNHYNYVYKFNPKTNSASELEQHTTTTIYIICTCLIIMLLGTILFAFVSKCQERRSAAQALSNTRPRRRSRSATNRTATMTNNNNNINDSSGRSHPQISIIMPINTGDEGAPPAYPKVAYEPPPTYDSLFPNGKV